MKQIQDATLNANRPTDLEAVFRELDQVQNDFSAFDLDFSERRNKLIERTYGLYLIAKTEKDILRHIEVDSIFAGKPRRYVKKRLMLCMFRFVLKAPSKGPLYERARVYAKAMDVAAAQNVAPNGVARFIEQSGGIERLYRRRSRPEASEEASKACQTANRPKRRPAPNKRLQMSWDDDLLVRSDPSTIKAILGSEMRSATLIVTIERIPGAPPELRLGGWLGHEPLQQ